MTHIQLNYASLLFWSFFVEIHWKFLFLVKKMTISERSSDILRKFVFPNKFEKEQTQRKIRICHKQLFLFYVLKLDKYKQKKIFSPQNEPIPPNFAFLLFWSIFGLIHWKIRFLVKKSDYLRKEQRNTQKVCFSKLIWKGANPEENLDLFKQLFWTNQ